MTETPDYCEMLTRMLRALGRRVADGDGPDLAAAVALAEMLDEQIAAGVAAMHDAGYSWAYIGEAVGTSRQAAFQRWGR